MNHLYRIFDDSNLLTLLAADPSASRPEWVSLCLFSCLPHPCWVPTDSFLANWAGLALHRPPSADRFQGALDPGSCPFSCRTQFYYLSRLINHNHRIKASMCLLDGCWVKMEALWHSVHHTWSAVNVTPTFIDDKPKFWIMKVQLTVFQKEKRSVESGLCPWLAVRPVSNNTLYSCTLVHSVQFLYISCYVFSNKPMLLYLLSRLLHRSNVAWVSPSWACSHAVLQRRG